MSFSADLTTPEGSRMVYELFSFELSTNDGHSWVKFDGEIQVVAYPEIKSDQLELPINMRSTVTLSVLDKRDLIRNGQIYPAFSDSVSVSIVRMRSLGSSLQSEMVVEIEPSSDMVGEKRYLLFTGETAQDVTTSFAVSFGKALLFHTQEIYHVLRGERLVLSGSGFNLMQSPIAIFNNDTVNVEVLDDFRASVHIEGSNGLHSVDIRHGLDANTSNVYSFVLLSDFDISELILEETEIKLSAYFDDA